MVVVVVVVIIIAVVVIVAVVLAVVVVVVVVLYIASLLRRADSRDRSDASGATFRLASAPGATLRCRDARTMRATSKRTATQGIFCRRTTTATAVAPVTSASASASGRNLAMAKLAKGSGKAQHRQ